MPGLLRAYARSVDDELREVELLRVRLPLVQPFRTAHNTTTVKNALLVRVRTSAAIGWGECTAQTTPEYDGETIDGAHRALRHHLVPFAFAKTPHAGATITTFEAVANDDTPGSSSARAALECALLDAYLRARGLSLASWLGAERTFVEAGVAVGMLDDLGALRALLRGYVEAGYRRIKCKIEPGHDIEILKAARAEVGPDVALAADANGSYTLDGARRLFAAVDDLELQCVEQPCAPDALAEHASLVGEVRTPICLDETITSPAAARTAIDRRACDAMSIKVGRLGITAAQRTSAACAAAGVGALPGGMLETGIGRAALIAVAALPGFTLAGDVSASARYFGADGDLTEPFVLDNGHLRVPTGPGLGVEPVAERLARYTTEQERITAPG
jgi:O-succinylbenzoate synthase